MSIQASVPAPAPPAGFQSKGGPKGKYASNLKKYGTPLPILLSSSPLHPQSKGKPLNDPIVQAPTSLLQSFISTLTERPIVPSVVGVFDPATRSVWVEDKEGMEILFNRGFFGKGTLSRSDPSWRRRQVDLVRGGDAFAAELMREKRRQERKQFKIDRAAAMLDAAVKAENVLKTGQLPGEPQEDEEDEDEQRDTPDRPASPAPSSMSLATDYTAALPPGTKLTPQTFLVRPTRPDASRNRGKNAFRRRPPPKTGEGAPAPKPAPPPAPLVESSSSESEDEASALVDDMEHLQLSLEEAWFLSSGIGVLRIMNPDTKTIVPPSGLLPLLLSPPDPEHPIVPAALYPDDPLFVQYAAYHHYRSLGWCVRHGIKFTVDWLLYRRGPVFSHSVFSVLLIPEYLDEEDRERSPYKGTDWYKERQSWKWLNTVMRVNSLVQKTVIVAYITIPPVSSFPHSMRLPGGGLDPRKLDMRTLMSRFGVREVSLTRFSAARRRD